MKIVTACVFQLEFNRELAIEGEPTVVTLYSGEDSTDGIDIDFDIDLKPLIEEQLGIPVPKKFTDEQLKLKASLTFNSALDFYIIIRKLVEQAYI